jgi:hypothetical protein
VFAGCATTTEADGAETGSSTEAESGEASADGAFEDESGGESAGGAESESESGGESGSDTGIDDPVFPDALEELPGVVSVEAIEDGFRIGFEQPVDHFDPDSDTFVQYLSLRSDGFDGAMILKFTGYYDYVGTNPGQLSFLVPGSNQLVVEHRYFGASLPEPAEWQFLSVEQAAADHHAIVEAFKLLYLEPWLSIGASKGGQTVLEHEQLYPQDIDASIALVAPIIPALYDSGFDPFVDGLANTSCGEEARAVHSAMLTRRAELKEQMLAEAADEGESFSQVGADAALDIAIAEWEFVFWQYTSDCGDLPAPDASAGALYAAMGSSSPMTYSDSSIAPFSPFFHQCSSQLGYPGLTDDHLDNGLFVDLPADYLTLLIPAGQSLPNYDSAAMMSLADWVQSEAAQVVMIYGAFDPWSARAVDPEGNEGVLYYMLDGENHGANLFKLSNEQRAEVCDALNEWTGLSEICADGFVDTPPLGRLGPTLL